MNHRFTSTQIDSCTIMPDTQIGLAYRSNTEPVVLGANIIIRSGTIIYADVQIGDDFQCGHHVLIREKTLIGNHVVVGTNTVIDGNCTIGNFVKIESNCYIPTHTHIGSRVFFGPNVVLTNDRYPLKMRDQYTPEGPIIEDGVTIGAGAVVCPGVTIGNGSFIAAGAVITRDVPAMSLAKGVPAVAWPLPEKLRGENMALSWMKFLNGTRND